MREPTRTDDLGEVLLEFQVFGMYTRVAAIHVATNTEIRVSCPTRYTRFSQEQAALRKLRYVLKRDGKLRRRW